MNSPIGLKVLDKRPPFNFRLDIGITNLNNMSEFVPITKHMKDIDSRIPIYPPRKKYKEINTKLLLNLSDINYVAYSR